VPEPPRGLRQRSSSWLPFSYRHRQRGAEPQTVGNSWSVDAEMGVIFSIAIRRGGQNGQKARIPRSQTPVWERTSPTPRCQTPVWERPSAKLCFAGRTGVVRALLWRGPTSWSAKRSFAEGRSQTGVWQRGED